MPSENDDASADQELIVCAAISQNGKVHSLPAPARHIDILSDMAARGIRPLVISVQGYITTYGRFVDRVEAFPLARKGGQIKHGPKGPPDLYTDDLW